MKNMYIHGSDKRNTQLGVTLVELVIAISVTIILSISIVSLIVVWLQQYSISSVRNNLSTDAQATIRRMSDDVRKSTKLLTANAVNDANAPTPPGNWTSNSTRLVLAQSPRKSNGDLAYAAGTYTGTPDSIIYYVNNGSMYRRVIPANYAGNVNLPLVTCAGTSAIGGCASDLKIGSDIKSINYVFYTKSGAVTTDPNLTTSIKMTLQLEKNQAGQTVTSTSSTVMTPRAVGSN